MKILGRFKAEKATFYKVSGYKTTIYHSWYLETFWKQALGTFRVWERQMNWIWCQNINYPLYQREVISLLSFSMTLRQGCRNVTMGPWKIHILRSSQSWCNIGATRNIDLEKTLLIWRSHYNIASTLPSKYLWYAVRLNYYPTLRQRWYQIVNFTP